MVLWCNGSTSDFESDRLGSSPGETTISLMCHVKIYV